MCINLLSVDCTFVFLISYCRKLRHNDFNAVQIRNNAVEIILRYSFNVSYFFVDFLSDNFFVNSFQIESYERGVMK